jgi:hypothetical protein
MVLPCLIRWFLAVACRQSTVQASLSALAAVLLLSAGLLRIDAAGSMVPAEEMQCAESDNCETVQSAEQEAGKEQTESRGPFRIQSGAEAVDNDKTSSELTKQFLPHATRIAERKQQQVERTSDAFGEATP